MSSGNNGFVKDIKIERIDDVSVLSTFYCGNGEMDDFIQAKENGLESFMKSKTDISTYVAKIEKLGREKVARNKSILRKPAQK